MLYESSQILSALFWCFANEDKQIYSYLYEIKSAEEEEANEWTGKMNETKKTIVIVGAQIKKEISENNKEIKAKIDQVNAKNEEMNAKIDQVNAKNEEMNAKIDMIFKKLDQ